MKTLDMGIFYDHLLVAAKQENLPLAQVCRLAAGMGYRYVDIDGEYYQANRSEADDMLASAGMRIGCVDGRFDLAHAKGQDGAEALIRLAAQGGIPHVLLIPGYVEQNDDRTAVMARIAEGLHPLVALGAELGVRCSLEDYDAQEAPFGTSDELLWYMQRVPGLGCTFDTGNFAYFGEDATRAFEALKPHIVALHLKDRASTSLRGEEGTPTADGRGMLYPCAVGEGSMPVAPIVRAYADTDMMMTVEHFGANRMLEVMRVSAESIKGWTDQKE